MGLLGRDAQVQILHAMTIQHYKSYKRYGLHARYNYSSLQFRGKISYSYNALYIK